MKPFQLTLIKLCFVVFFAAMLLANVMLQEQISAIAQLNKPFIQPANYTFSIWSVIYGWFFCWIVYSFIRSKERDELYFRLRYLLPLSFSLNIAWLIAYTSEQSLLAVLFIFLLLATTIFLYLKAKPFIALGWFTIRLFSIYLGWVSTAAIVNLFSFINQLSPPIWTDLEQVALTSLALIILCLFALYSLIRWQDKVLPLTLVWSFIGIAVNRAHPVTTVLCIIFAAIIGLAVLIKAIRKK